MSKTGNVKLSATEEKERLDAWHAEESKRLAAAVEEERRAEVERKAAENEKRLDGLREDAVEHAAYLVSLADKATKLTDELCRVLLERRESSDDFLGKYREICNFGHHFHVSQNYRIALADLDLLRERRRPNGRHQTFVDIDIRALHPVLPAKTLARATA